MCASQTTLVSPQLRGKRINQVRERAIRKLSGIAILMGMMVLAFGMVWNLPPANASSHREAPLISADPLADNTDLYSFVSPDKPDTVTIIANWIPFEEPAGGPNFNGFGDDVRYEIYIDNNGDAKADITYYFRFTTHVRNPNTFLYNVGPIKSLDDPNWNVYQTYTITRVDANGSTVVGENLTSPPVNIGPKSTPNYDALAQAAVHTLSNGTKVFAGQRDDPFFVDLGSVFDLLTIRKLPGNQGGGKDDLKGYNCHTIALQISISRLTKDGSVPKDPKDGAAVIGVWTTSSRKATSVLRTTGQPPTTEGDWVQVSRLGMPLVNEVVVPLGAKDLWNGSKPEDDAQFLAGVTDPEPAHLLKLLYNINVPPTPRDDLVAIFLTGIPGLNQPPNIKPSEQLRLNVAIPPSAKPHPLGVVGGDNAGFPNGRRLADDVTDVALKAVAGAVYPLFHPDFKADPVAGLLGDGVDQNDMPFMKTFPYVASPHQGFEHAHDPAAGDANNVFFLQLDAGLNMISLPLQPSKPHTARSLMQEIGATIAIELDSKRQSFRGFTASDAGQGFSIEGGKGYIVNVPQAKAVTFVGSPWRNTPPVEAAPPSDVPTNTWAFILAANVEALQGDPRFPGPGDMTLTVHNPRAGRVEAMATTEMPGTLHAVWADLSRRSVVEADDVLEIQVRDGARLVGVMRHAITSDEITRAFAQLRLTPQDLLPTKTLLFANYPNPFNPETWVPYQLAKDTDVSIHIYDSAGRSVRALNLGYKAAGYYLDKSRAAYWDGRNDAGERMASGVYFYQLVAGQSTSTRKLVILK